MQMNEMPSIGTTLSYGEAIEAYGRFERTMLEKAYGAGILPAVGLYDLLWQLESLAQKFGIEGKGAFSRLKREIRSFSSERAALANGVNGKRFYLMQDSQALRRHDETHIFRVGFDGEALVGELGEALALLADEAGGGRRVRRRVFSRLARSGFHKPRRGPLPQMAWSGPARADGLPRHLPDRSCDIPGRSLLQVVLLAPLRMPEALKIGQNRSHDPAPQTRGFLTGSIIPGFSVLSLTQVSPVSYSE